MSTEISFSFAHRAFAVMLKLYPAGFRDQYGTQMAQLFRDCHRRQKRCKARFGVLNLWVRTLIDVVRTAPREHFENLRKEDSFMHGFRKDVPAMLGCIAIVIIAFALLSFGRKNEVASILIFGHALDAVVFSGIVGNVILFLFLSFTRLNSVRVAFWTFAIVNGLPAFALSIIGTKIDPHFRLGAMLAGHFVSFLFWFGIHWAWDKTRGQLAITGEE